MAQARKLLDALTRHAGDPRRRRDPPRGLTKREVEVLRLVADGLNNQVIADGSSSASTPSTATSRTSSTSSASRRARPPSRRPPVATSCPRRPDPPRMRARPDRAIR